MEYVKTSKNSSRIHKWWNMGEKVEKWGKKYKIIKYDKIW